MSFLFAGDELISRLPWVVSLRSIAVLFSVICMLSTASVFAASDPEAYDIVKRAWEHWRGLSSYSEMTMTIHRTDWERTMAMRIWTEGQSRSLVRVTAPKKDAGNGTLLIDKSMWTYSPKINRIIKIPSSMMNQSWMGSDFTNNDVSRSDNILDQYDHRLIDQYDLDGKRVNVIESTPHEDASVVWGKEVLHVRDDHILMLQEFYDQEDQLVKSLRTLAVEEMGGRTIASQQRMQKVDAENEWTEIKVSEAKYDISLDSNLFTRSNLRNPRE
ncbi:MAG: outer membrane lipoprotein-sorting protein [Arenicellales bacterium]|nr:outer membrane lipoprotein-sorting protein [Arenicellales bacterium]